MSIRNNIRLLKWQNACIGFMPGSPIFILYFAEVAGSVAGGAAVFAASMVVAAIADIPTGVLSDRVGRRITAIAGNVVITVCLCAYALAPNLEWLLVAAALDGLGMALWSGNTSALLYESLEDIDELERLAHETGRLHGSMHWSMAAAAVVGGLLAVHSLQWAIWASVPGLVFAVILSWRLQEPAHRHKSGSTKEHLRDTLALFRNNKPLVALAWASMLTTGVSMSAFVLRATWSALLWPVWAIGIARGASAVLAAVGTWWGGYFINRFGAIKSILGTQLAASAGAFAALSVPTVVSPAVLTASSLAYGVGTTADNVLLQREYSSKQRATMSSVVGLGGRLIFGIITVVLGLLADAVSPGVALIVAEAVLVGSLPLYVLYQRRQRRGVASRVTPLGIGRGPSGAQAC